jgi:transketolase
MRDEAIGRVVQRMADDDRIVFLTGDLGFGVLDQMAATYPNRLVNAGVAEQNMLAMAAGLALEGFRPFVYSIANFPTLRAFEQLRNDICYHRLPVRIISIGGGIGYGPLGVSHHATDDLGSLGSLPNLALFTPSTADEVLALTDAACEWDGPAYLRLDRGDMHDAAAPVTTPGVCNVWREGSDATIVTFGCVLREVMSAAADLAERGVDVRVLSAVSLRPFDTAAALDAARRGPVITVEEHGRVGGLATLFAQTCLEGGVAPSRFVGLSLGDDFVRAVGSTEWLRAHHGLDAASIAKQVELAVRG